MSAGLDDLDITVVAVRKAGTFSCLGQVDALNMCAGIIPPSLCSQRQVNLISSHRPLYPTPPISSH
jgi:hypothetical protein